jgi:hypothetical protein
MRKNGRIRIAGKEGRTPQPSREAGRMSQQSSHEPGSQYLTIETPEQVHLD